MHCGASGKDGDFAEQGEKAFGVFDLVCSLPSGNLSWVPEHTTECVIKTADKVLQLSWLTGFRKQKARKAGCTGQCGAEMRGAGPKCGEQEPSSLFLVPKSYGFGVMISGSLRGDPPGRLNTSLGANM